MAAPVQMGDNEASCQLKCGLACHAAHTFMCHVATSLQQHTQGTCANNACVQRNSMRKEDSHPKHLHTRVRLWLGRPLSRKHESHLTHGSIYSISRLSLALCVGLRFLVRLRFALRSLAVWRVRAVASSFIFGWRAFPSVSLCKSILYLLYLG
jgi:hypothetical protein